ncbi:hypothetical protein BDR05DRAFT_969464 [Suillus weaverae]|nr:hypothetical protein BDR05DRAFT_969464 [Suillus weaverae]
MSRSFPGTEVHACYLGSAVKIVVTGGSPFRRSHMRSTRPLEWRRCTYSAPPLALATPRLPLAGC